MMTTADMELKQKAAALFTKASLFLAPQASPETCEGFFNNVWDSGQQTNRFFHDSEHFLDIAGRGKIQNWLDAVHFRAGMNHDVVYHHIDIKEHLQKPVQADTGSDKQTKGFAPGVRKLIGGYVTGDIHLQLSRSPSLDDDKLFQAALTIFGFDNAKRKNEGISLNPLNGQNEFLSALYGMKQAQALGIPDKYILAEMAHIEATIPFGPQSGSHDRFELLEDRLTVANDALKAGLGDKDIERVVHSAVEMANKDVASFKWDFSRFIKRTFLFNAENVQGSVENLDKPAPFFQNCLGTALFLESVVGDPEKAIFHSFRNHPHKKERTKDENKAKSNILTLREYLTANAVAVALMTALENANNPTNEPEHQKLDYLFLHKFSLKATHTGELTAYGKAALKYARKEGGTLISDPVAAFLLEELGSDAIKQLANVAKEHGIEPVPANDAHNNPYPKPGMLTKQTAEDFLSKVEELFCDKDMDFAPVRHQLEAFREAPGLIPDAEKAPANQVFDVAHAKTMTSAIALKAGYGQTH